MPKSTLEEKHEQSQAKSRNFVLILTVVNNRAEWRYKKVTKKSSEFVPTLETKTFSRFSISRYTAEQQHRLRPTVVVSQ